MLDLWDQLWTLLDAREGSVEVLWTKAHSTAGAREVWGISRVEFFLNCVADFFAGEAAALGEVPQDHVNVLNEVDDMTGKVLSRLLDVNREVNLTCRRL
eukprot:9486525-Pyramimonas_sp.AAC.1